LTLLIATDLDACLLDHATYRWDEAQGALRSLRARAIPLALLSSKTFTEMRSIAAELSWPDAPLVVENGGALAWPVALPGDLEGAAVHEGYAIVPLGTPRPQLAEALARWSVDERLHVRAVSAMDDREISERTGLSGAAAAAVRRRDWSEPFVVSEEGEARTIATRAAGEAMRVVQGGRFWHLIGATDKGRGLQEVRRRFVGGGGKLEVVGLGDSPVDLPLLRESDRAVIVPRPEGEVHGELSAALPEAEVAPWPGPRGWNAAVLAVIEGHRLKTVGEVMGAGR
jgi:mannosyl-3-phosphoglycerate phosphatase